MHYDENEHRHSHHREMRHPRHREEHFNDFRSRWEEPEPLSHLDHQPWQPHHTNRPENQDFYQQNEDWHDPRHNQYEQPAWRRHDTYSDRNSQRVEDRWSEGDFQRAPRHHDYRGQRPHHRNEHRDENDY